MPYHQSIEDAAEAVMRDIEAFVEAAIRPLSNKKNFDEKRDALRKRLAWLIFMLVSSDKPGRT